MKVIFISGFGPIVDDDESSRSLYMKTLGIEFKEEEGGYLHTGDLSGSKTFALWPLTHAAQSCFGTDNWPDSARKPNSWIEFDVDDIESATEELKKQGYRLLVQNRLEPWGQIVTRFISPEGILVGITHTPWMREKG